MTYDQAKRLTKKQLIALVVDEPTTVHSKAILQHGHPDDRCAECGEYATGGVCTLCGTEC
jgi:hypothetical protein